MVFRFSEICAQKFFVLFRVGKRNIGLYCCVRDSVAARR
jgi:hypothetical protein